MCTYWNTLGPDEAVKHTKKAKTDGWGQIVSVYPVINQHSTCGKEKPGNLPALANLENVVRIILIIALSYTSTTGKSKSYKY
jgi:hypothetical protein